MISRGLSPSVALWFCDPYRGNKEMLSAATLRQPSSPCRAGPQSNARSGGPSSLLLPLLYTRTQQEAYQQAEGKKMKHFLPGWSHLVGACTEKKAEDGVKMVRRSPQHGVQCCRAELWQPSWSPMHSLASPGGSRRPKLRSSHVRWHRGVFQGTQAASPKACAGNEGSFTLLWQKRNYAWCWRSSSWGTRCLLSLHMGGSPLYRFSLQLASVK